METKIRRRQNYIIIILGCVGLFFILVSFGNINLRNPIFLFGVVFCLVSISNLIFYRRIIEKNMQYEQNNPGSLEKTENTLRKIIKPFYWVQDARMICLGLVVVFIGLYAIITTGSLSGLSYFIALLLVYIFYFWFRKK